MKKIGMLIIVVVVLVLGIINLSKDNITLEIKNLTNKDISNFYLNYTGIKEDIKISNIKSNDSIKFKVNIDSNFEEGSMKIYYIDKDNKRKNFTIIGYFTKGHRENVKVNIIDKNGDIEVNIIDKNGNVERVND